MGTWVHTNVSGKEGKKPRESLTNPRSWPLETHEINHFNLKRQWQCSWKIRWKFQLASVHSVAVLSCIYCWASRVAGSTECRRLIVFRYKFLDGAIYLNRVINMPPPKAFIYVRAKMKKKKHNMKVP